MGRGAPRWPCMHSLITACLVPIALAAPTAVLACGNAVHLERSRVTRLIAQAEQALEKGEAHRARRLTGEVARAHWKRSPGLVRRFRMAKGLASIRTGSALRGVPLLKKIKATDDPALSSALAEGLSVLKGQHGEALRLLADLEARDLIPDAFGYAALARLRREKGDEQGALRAQSRCEAMAPKPGICKPPAPKKMKRRFKQKASKARESQS